MFQSFLSKLRDIDYTLVECISEAHRLIFEDISDDIIYSKKLVFECRDGNGSLNEMLKLYKISKVSGTYLIDAECGKPETAYLLKLHDSEKLDISSEDADHKHDTKRTRYTIELTSTSTYGNDRCDSILESIEKLVTTLGNYGNGGHSFEIKFIPNSVGKTRSFGWDGDGSDFIDMDSIKISKLDILNESSGGSELLVVDIQPEYEKWFSFKMFNFVNMLNSDHGNYTRITFLYNGHDTLGMVKESDYISWLYEHGLEEEVIDRINFYDKGYNFFRNAMDSGVDHDEIVHLISFMAKHRVNDSRDVDGDMWDVYMGEYPNDVNIRETLEGNEDAINIPDLIDTLSGLGSGMVVMGGGKSECLAEVLIALKYLGKSFKLDSRFVY